MYNYWNDRRDKDPIMSDTFINIIWFIIYINSILMLIVLLNFLIAIVSESYAKVNEIKIKIRVWRKA